MSQPTRRKTHVSEEMLMGPKIAHLWHLKKLGGIPLKMGI